MAKTMARIENDIVINIEWFSDEITESDILKNIGDYPVGIGDTYSNGKFYRDGTLLLTNAEELQMRNLELEEALKIMGVKL